MVKSVKDNVFLVTIVLISTLLILFYSTQKINFNVDELLTYSLSNGVSSVNPVPGTKYESYGEFQKSFLTPSDDTKFNYGNVWRNQANDVHPPFYYIIIHTISSFFPDFFSKYIGISVNIFFNMLIILLLYKSALFITNDKKIAYVTILFWAINPGIISDNMFIRMYIMAMFFCLLLSYVHIKKINGLSVKDAKFYLSIFLVSSAGILTHYYFLVFAFFLCALFSLSLLFRKKYKELIAYAGTYIVTIISVWAIFPSIYFHLFGGGYRGTESIQNLKNKAGYLESLKTFWGILSNNLFGGYLLVSMILIVALMAFYLFKNKISMKNEHMVRLGFLLIPCLLFFLLVSKIAVYKAERYIQLIYPIIILIFVSLIFLILKRYLNDKKSTFIMCAILIVMVVSGYARTCSFEYLVPGSQEAIELSRQYHDKDSIYIYNANWKVQTSFMELEQYKSVTFILFNNLELLNNNLHYDDFVLYIDPSIENEEEILNSIVDKFPEVEKYTKLYNYAYSNAYYFE